MDNTTIEVPLTLRDELRRRKVHPNQPYYEVIEELIMNEHTCCDDEKEGE